MNRIRLVHSDTLSCEPILRRAPDGCLVCVCQCGDVREPAPGNRVFVFRSDDEGESWSAPQLIRPEDGRAVYATEVMRLGDGLHAFLTLHDGGFLNWTCAVAVSGDGGRTWQDGGPPPVFAAYAFLRGMIRLHSGALLIPYQHYPVSPEENDRLVAQGGRLAQCTINHVENGVLRSRDGGATYERCAGPDIPIRQDTGRNWAWTEPTIAEVAPGRVVMLLRVCGTGCLWRSESADAGASWSPAVRTDIPNPGNKPKLIVLPGGAVALIHTPNPTPGFRNRSPLSVWVSHDGLLSFDQRVIVTDFPGAFCYPDGFYEDGRLLFTIEHNRHDILFISQELP